MKLSNDESWVLKQVNTISR